MKFINHILCMTLLLSISINVSADRNLFDHVTAVSQAMSALYMQGLSEGNVKYEKEMAKYKQNATEALNRYLDSNTEQANTLQKEWETLSSKIKVKYTEDYGWDVESALRMSLREYQSKIYQLSMQQTTKEDDVISYHIAKAQLEAIIARFFDISSSYDGTFSLSSSDLEKLDPKVISKEFKKRLVKLAEKSKDKKLARKLDSANNKWKFIEKSVVDYDNKSASFIVYATKNSINKVLTSGSSLQASN